MSRLTDLPNELLHEIMLLASDDGFDRTCLKSLAVIDKRLGAIVVPLLVRRWKSDRGRFDFGKLVLHLLRYPEHRSKLKSLCFENCTGYLPSLGELSFPAAVWRVALPRESLAELAEEVKRTMPDLAEYSDSWINRIREGYMDAVLVMVLAWATQLTHLHLRFHGHDSFVEKALLGRCVSRLSQLSTADIGVGLFLEVPRRFQFMTPDFLVSRLPGSLRELVLDWHQLYFIDTPHRSIAYSLEARSRILEATCELMQEAGPGHKFSKLSFFGSNNIFWWPRQRDRAVKTGEGRGVNLVTNCSVYGWIRTKYPCSLCCPFWRHR